LRLRFDLRNPRLRVQARGEVMWSTRSGQCGIRFLHAAGITRQIDEWIFANLLDGMSLLLGETAPNPSRSSLVHATLIQPIDGPLKPLGSPGGTMARAGAVAEVDDGLVISPTEVKVIELLTQAEAAERHDVNADPIAEEAVPAALEPDWVSPRLSGRGLALLVNALVMVAALLLFALVFLWVTGETPRWPAAMSAGAVTVVAMLYWGFFKLFGNESPGARLVRLAGFDSELKEEEQDTRFR
jgi:hypothetical protein